MRALTLAFVGLVALFWTAVLFATWNEPHGLFGWNLGSDGKTLVYITPGGPAEKAGLRVGDRIEWSTLPLRGRANLGIIEGVPPSTRLPVTIYRGSRTRTVVLAPLRWPAIFEVASRTVTLGGLFLLAVGIALVQLRPSSLSASGSTRFILASTISSTACCFGGATSPRNICSGRRARFPMRKPPITSMMHWSSTLATHFHSHRQPCSVTTRPVALHERSRGDGTART